MQHTNVVAVGSPYKIESMMGGHCLGKAHSHIKVYCSALFHRSNPYHRKGYYYSMDDMSDVRWSEDWVHSIPLHLKRYLVCRFHGFPGKWGRG